MLRSLFTLSTLAVASAGLATSAHAASVSLSFDALPSAQGWTYSAAGDGAGLAETDVYEATGSGLIQDTIGVGQTTPGQNLYEYGIAIGATESWSLTVRANIRQSEGLALNGVDPYPFGLSIAVATEGAYNLVGVAGPRFAWYAPGGITYADFAPGFDPAANNTYELIGNGGLTTFRINGVTLLDNIQFANLGVASSLLYGDGTGFGNASVFTTFYQFDSAVPEPASWAMMVAGFGVIGAASRRRGQRRVLA